MPAGTGSVVSCRNCGAAIASGHRFCERCGTRVDALTCVHCGSALDLDARFCCRCGAKSFHCSEENTASEFLLAAVGLALQQAAPQSVLDACQCCLRKNPRADHAALASVLAMHAYAKLGRFAEGRGHLILSRQFYASHLGFTTEQQDRYVLQPALIDDLLPAGNRDLEEHPWLWPILGHAQSPLLPDSYNGQSEAARQAQALEAWGDLVENRREGLIGIMGFLSQLTVQYSSARRHLRKLLLIARRYEHLQPCRPELLWPRVALGDCYSDLGDVETAKQMWRHAASVRVCLTVEHDDFSQCVLPWIDKAETRLLGTGERLPSSEATRQASDHIRKAYSYLLAAEQFETKGEGLSDQIRRAGSQYYDLVHNALSEIRKAESLDAFAWAKTPTQQEYWCHFDCAKALALQKNGIWQMSNNRLALAIASFNEANEIWPTLSSVAVMGSLQFASGLAAEATHTYQTCIDRADELSAVESSDDSQQTLREVREAINSMRR